MYQYILLLFLLFHSTTYAQVIWSEDFNSYTDGTATGNNDNSNNPTPDWQSTCPSSAAATDYFDVRNGLLEGRDTNGDAFWTSEDIDISSQPIGVVVSMDLSKQGDLEGCNTCASTCNCTDFIKVETSVDGGAFIENISPFGGTCNRASCTNGDYVTLGNFNDFTFVSNCLIGNTLQIRITVQTWAGTEFLRVDNIAVAGNTGNCMVLSTPVESFEVTAHDNHAHLNWTDNPDDPNAQFIVERSSDAVNFELVHQQWNNTTNNYSWVDETPLPHYNYYRIQSIDQHGEKSYSPTKVVDFPTGSESVQLYPNPANNQVNVRLDRVAQQLQIRVLDITGKCHYTQTATHSHHLQWKVSSLPSGTYWVAITSDRNTVYKSLVIF
ncbi:MAG: T9SS type A sorting domain-containing protein [Aureispira sp.]